MLFGTWRITDGVATLTTLHSRLKSDSVDEEGFEESMFYLDLGLR